MNEVKSITRMSRITRESLRTRIRACSHSTVHTFSVCMFTSVEFSIFTSIVVVVVVICSRMLLQGFLMQLDAISVVVIAVTFRVFVIIDMKMLRRA